ncbi:MAG: hypothetical protein AB7E61_06360 [Acholeplasmataceae bacterium]
MSPEQKLKDYILTKHRSVMEFSNRCNLPYTTVVGILKKSINRASVTTIIQICDCLQIDVDELVKGNIVEISLDKLSIDYQIEEIYNDLSIEEKTELLNFAEYIKNKNKK